MELVQKEDVTRWKGTLGSKHPVAVNLNCPHCGARGTFTSKNATNDTSRKTVAATADCPTCQEAVHLWSINDLSAEFPKVYVYPPPGEIKTGLERKDLISNERIRKAYIETLSVYNAGIWSASLTLARRTLEGIVTEIKPDGKGSLAKQLKELQVANLDKPLLELTEAVKDGGNFGAHFDPEREPDQAMAEATLELIEYLVEYIYILPAMVKNLQEQISKGIATTIKTDEPESSGSDSTE